MTEFPDIVLTQNYHIVFLYTPVARAITKAVKLKMSFTRPLSRATLDDGH